jgi:ribosomal protein L37E
MRTHQDCRRCGRYRSIFFRFDGRVRRDRKHDVCCRCFRSLRSAWNAVNLIEGGYQDANDGEQ